MSTQVNTRLLTISSSAAKEEEMIPSRYTCEGENINPPLHIEGIPEGAQSLALIMEDPDAPRGTFDHWLLWNLPVKNIIEENNQEGIAGVNGFGKAGYGGPCPLSGTHRYFFRVYALESELSLPAGSNKKALLDAIDDKVMAMGELMVKYHKIRTDVE
jgi:Raf kinase inhibitor-like YbhB/YbcL family protein